jgi:hypothetical protein
MEVKIKVLHLSKQSSNEKKLIFDFDFNFNI